MNVTTSKPAHSPAANRSSTVEQLLETRERQALRTSLLVKTTIVVLMLPLAWAVGGGLLFKLSTVTLMVLYGGALLMLWRRVATGHYRRAALISVGLDAVLLAALPILWYVAIGGLAQPFGLLLKTSVTVLSLMLIAQSALALRPLYPILTTLGALAVHLVLLLGAALDSRTVFTMSYGEAYTSASVATGKVAVSMVILVVVGGLMAALAQRARRMVEEGVELQRTRGQLERYFSPNLADRLMNNPGLFEVGGERRALSFVFTDLEGFTALVESAPPEDLVPALNGYLDTLVQVTFDHDGTVDKIVGDAVHVMFGAPAEQPDHAARAVACAIAMHHAAERYRAGLPERLRFGRTRIGVNSGEAVVGNFGGEALFDYTAHGDAVNIAARLEGANRQLGTSVCVSDATTQAAPEVESRPVGQLTLKGIGEPVMVHEPLAAIGPGAAPLDDYRAAFGELESESATAPATFSALAGKYPEDVLVRLHHTRLTAGETGTRLGIPTA